LRFDRQAGQAIRLLFAVEAQGMVPQVQRIAEEYGIAVHSSGGFDSVTAKYEMAKRFGEYEAVEVLHLGDHDPSGVHIFSLMEEDVTQFAEDSGYAVDIKFTRLAVTRGQI
jgi:DNA topoisomerase VI subunit A